MSPTAHKLQDPNLKDDAAKEQMFPMFTLQRPRSVCLQQRRLINHDLLEET